MVSPLTDFATRASVTPNNVSTLRSPVERTADSERPAKSRTARMCKDTRLIYTDGTPQINPETGKAQKWVKRCDRAKEYLSGHCPDHETEKATKVVGPSPHQQDPRRASEPY